MTRQPFQVNVRIPLAVGVSPSARRCAPRATRRAVAQDTPVAVMRDSGTPEKRVPGYGFAIEPHDRVVAAWAGAAAARAARTAARSGRRMREPVPRRAPSDAWGRRPVR